MQIVGNLNRVLQRARSSRYGVGSFSARYTGMIRPIIEAAMQTRSPAIVQLSEKEVHRHRVPLAAFADEFYRLVEKLQPAVPLVLHLDHTRTISVIEEAIAAGFTSVMIDASEYGLEENMRITGEVVRMAHPGNVTVEGELGRIGTTDFVETDRNEVVFTDPDEAALFAEQTGVDALAISVGTAHGLYTGMHPRIDMEIIRAINARTAVPLVLHGGSGVSDTAIAQAVSLEEGGVSKVNIASELEKAMLDSLGRSGHMTEQELLAVSPQELRQARAAVSALVVWKIRHALGSAGAAVSFSGNSA